MKINIYFFLVFFLVPSLVFGENTGANFLRIDKSVQSDDGLSITSIGGFGFIDEGIGHVDLSYIASDIEGDGLAMDAGADFTYTAGATFFLGGGFLIGFNWDNSEFIGAIYPEAGISFNYTQSLGITLSAKRFFNLYDDTEDVIMFGLLFSDR